MFWCPFWKLGCTTSTFAGGSRPGWRQWWAGWPWPSPSSSPPSPRSFTKWWSGGRVSPHPQKLRHLSAMDSFSASVVAWFVRPVCSWWDLPKSGFLKPHGFASGESVFQEEAAKCGDSHLYGRRPWTHHVHKPAEWANHVRHLLLIIIQSLLLKFN